MNMKRMLCILQIALLLGGLAIVAKPVYRLARWKVDAFHGRRFWDNRVNRDNNRRVLAAPAALLYINAVDLVTPILHGADEENLFRYPCLELSGPNLNETGVKVILGHRDMHFRKLSEPLRRQSIHLELPDGTKKKYTIMETEIIDKDLLNNRLQDKKNEDWLVLVTCYPFRYTGPAPKRFLVWALH